MLVKYVIEAFLAGISSMLSLIPSLSFPTTDSVPAIFANVYPFKDVFPLVWLLTCVGITITLKLALNGWDFIVFAYHQFWGSN